MTQAEDYWKNFQKSSELVGDPMTQEIRPKNYWKTRYRNVSNTDWLEVVAPINCNYVGLRTLSGNSFLLRSNKDDANTEDLVESGKTELVTAMFNEASPWVRDPGTRWILDETVIFVQAVEVGDDIVATFVR